MLRTTWDRPRPLASHLGLQFSRRASGVHILGVWQLRHDAIKRVRADKLALASVPLGEDGGARCTTQYTRMDQTGKAHMRDMSGGAEDAFKIPDRLGSIDVACSA